MCESILNRLPFPSRVFFGHFVMIRATCKKGLTPASGLRFTAISVYEEVLNGRTNL
jgi:hypothetical protein